MMVKISDNLSMAYCTRIYEIIVDLLYELNWPHNCDSIKHIEIIWIDNNLTDSTSIPSKWV